MARIPDKREHQQRLAQLDFAERRAIVRAVNRGRAVDRKAHAPLAVAVARRQQRFWRYAWLLGPAIGAVQLLFADLETAVINAIIGTVALGMMSAYWLWRARRSEQLNLELAEGRRRAESAIPVTSGMRFWRGRKGTTAQAEPDEGRVSRPRGHLPGEESQRGTAASAGDGEEAGDQDPGAEAPDLGPRPPAPRGKKRRR